MHTTWYVVVRGTWYVVRGTWYVVRGTWYVVRGTWYVVRGTGRKQLVASYYGRFLLRDA